jgi:hypothetical protein
MSKLRRENHFLGFSSLREWLTKSLELKKKKKKKVYLFIFFFFHVCPAPNKGRQRFAYTTECSTQRKNPAKKEKERSVRLFNIPSATY